MSYQNIIVETKGRVGIIRLNRPQALNALNRALIAELIQAIDAFEADDGIGCLLLTGSDKAFAAGADIKEMADKSFIDVFLGNFAREPLRAADAGDDAELDLGLAEFGTVGGDDDVAMHGQLAAAAEREAGDRGDDRLGGARGAGPPRPPNFPKSLQ